MDLFLVRKFVEFEQFKFITKYIYQGITTNSDGSWTQSSGLPFWYNFFFSW